MMTDLTDPHTIPLSIQERVERFLQPYTWGRVELDVENGKVVRARLIESIRPLEELPLREGGRRVDSNRQTDVT